MKTIGLMSGVLLLVCAAGQAQIQSEVKPNEYVRVFKDGDKTLRRFVMDLKAGSFSGNTVRDVSGTAIMENEKGSRIAAGQLQVVSGWIAVKGSKGASFKLVPEFDTRPTPSSRLTEKASTPPTVVTLTPSDEWKLDDDTFMFLIDSSYGFNPDFSSSFARNTRILLPPNKTIELWGNKVSTDAKGGELLVRNGKVVNLKGAKIDKSKK